MKIQQQNKCTSYVQAGFTLIEILIAGLIATLLSSALFLVYMQVNKAAQTIENIVDIDNRIVTLIKQVERDISGVCVPFSALPEKKDKQVTTTQAAPAQSPTQEALKEQQQKKRKQMTHLFYGINKNDQLDLLTFITNNPLQVYWSDRAGKAKPCIARVVYRLEQENNKNLKRPSYALKRQEAYALNFDDFRSDAPQQIRAYTLVSGIKKCAVSYGVEVESDSQEKSNKEFKISDQWDLENKDAKDDKQRPVPNEVTFTITLWEQKQKRDTTITFTIPIIPDFSKPKEEEKKTPQVPQVQPTQPGQLGQTLPQVPGVQPLLPLGAQIPGAQSGQQRSQIPSIPLTPQAQSTSQAQLMQPTQPTQPSALQRTGNIISRLSRHGGLTRT